MTAMRRLTPGQQLKQESNFERRRPRDQLTLSALAMEADLQPVPARRWRQFRPSLLRTDDSGREPLEAV